jgi:osmoprotectant transport system ATP-binding protein
MIEVQNVSKTFGSSTVLSELSFTVPKGDTCALLGLSGSGKTTAMKLICGLIKPDSGSITVRDIPVKQSRLSEVRSQLGYVIQDGGLFPHMTAYQNISIVGRQAGWRDERIQTRLNELAELTKLHLSELTNYPRQLSGGQRQRVGLMRALLLDPPILLLDEPLGALDPITRSELQGELRELCTRLKKTVLLVTHDLFEAGYLARQIMLLHKGQIVQRGSLADLIRQPVNDFVRRFVDSQKHPQDPQ